MNYCLYKLKFTTPVHIGESDRADSLATARMTLCADTLFSALCHAASSDGQAGAGTLCETVRSGRLLLSDAMPYSGENLYIPKPFMKARGPARGAEIAAEDRKAMKKLSHIPVSSLGEFLSSVSGAGHYDAKTYGTSFGRSFIAAKNAIGRTAGASGENPVSPYNVGAFEFNPDCGLYFIAAFGEQGAEKRLLSLIERLGTGGVGGRTSSGYGKFTPAEDPRMLADDNCAAPDGRALFKMLSREEAPLYISLTTSLPLDGELDAALDGAAYGISRRGGFVFSDAFAGSPVKKKTQYFLSAGSVFTHKYRGGLYEAAKGGNHPVYRYGMPLFLGVDAL